MHEEADKMDIMDTRTRHSDLLFYDVQIYATHISRHHPDFSEQPTLAHPLIVRFAQRGRRQQSTSHLMRRRLVSSNSDRSLGEQQASEIVHATIVAHTAHDTFRIRRISDVGVSDSAPFDEFFAGLSVGSLVFVEEYERV